MESNESNESRIRHLETELRRHRRLYYQEQPEISDAEFDALEAELRTLDPDNPVLGEVGAPVGRFDDPDLGTAGLPTKAHKIPMGSLEKIAEDKLDAWAEKTGPLFLVQEKYDGISLEVEYEKGRMVDAITRGDGFVGEVVTHNAVHFKNIRRELKTPFTGSVRAEVILRLSVFDAHFAGLDFANPRNTVSGTVRKKHGDRSLNKHFELFFYDVIDEGREFETEHEKMLYLRDDLGLTLAVSHFDCDADRIREIYDGYLGSDDAPGSRASLDYEIDGLVVRADSLSVQKKLGSLHNRPRYAMAYKFPSEGQETTLLAVDWSLGLGSRVTPVARLEPVPISGVTVSNATLHNVDRIKSLGIRIGDVVLVERRGDVIPQVERVVESRGGELPATPETCPVCDAPLEMDGKFLLCPNEICPGKAYGDIFRWIQELEIDSLGEKWVRILIEEELLRDPADLYALDVESLLPLERMGKTLAAKIVRNIDATRSPPLDRFLAGLNLPGFSRQRARMLMESGVESLEHLQSMSVEEIAAEKGFGDILAQAIVDGLAQRGERIEKLRVAGVVPQKAPPMPAPGEEGSGTLSGKTFCFTGTVKTVDPDTDKRYTRKQLQDLVAEHGGRSLSSVTSGLDYLVMADPESKSSKAKKARELGTTILSEEDFFTLLGE